ncbi:MAG: PepSY domain-containing protein [Clostridia bacterium]|nr:PepSY domain-containing protein [Clostridia bacterium]
MKKKPEEKLYKAFSHATPDILDSILSDLQEGAQKGNIFMMQEKKSYAVFRKWAAAAVAGLILVTGIAGAELYRTNRLVASTISLDVNPCIQIYINRKEKVLQVAALNEDGKTVIGDMDFTGSSLDITVNALIGSMLRNGYLSDIANSILVSVDSEDVGAAASIQNRLTEEISTLLQTDSFTGAVLSQTIQADSTLQTLADTYGITTGKAELIRQIIESSGLHTFDELANLSINELNLLANAGQLDTVSSVGEASTKAYIGRDEAVQIARNHAGAYGMTMYECEMDWENGVMVYEVDFWYDGWEYDYDVNATTGEVVRAEKEEDKSGRSGITVFESKVKVVPEAGKQTQDGTISQMPNMNAQVIGEEAARAIALEHAGVTAEQIYDYDCELDRDNGKIRYEIDFQANGYEYEYELDAESGKILKSDKERD